MNEFCLEVARKDNSIKSLRGLNTTTVFLFVVKSKK